MAINTTFSSSVLTSGQMNNLPWGYISYTYNTTASINNSVTTAQALYASPAFTPVAGRLYRVSWNVGFWIKTTNAGNVVYELRQGSTTGNILDSVLYSPVAANTYGSIQRTQVLTSAQMGTSSFAPYVCVTVNTAGINTGNSATYPGSIIVEDIGLA
jgi:hypothetical protein